MNRLSMLLSASLFTLALAAPAAARDVSSPNLPGCDGEKDKKDDKKNPSAIPTCDGEKDKKDDKKNPSADPACDGEKDGKKDEKKNPSLI
jgi:hypothetical protein